MKIIILLVAVCLLSCNSGQSDLEKVNALIDSQNKKWYRDSTRIDRQMQIDIARAELEHATGKKDTLTNAEHLKKAEESFK